MLNCARLLAAALLLAALTLCVGQEAVPSLSCSCRHDSVRSTVENIACDRNEKDQLVCSSVDVPDLPSGYKWVQGYGLYKLYRTGRSFHQAAAHCQLDGARLAVPKDEFLLSSLTDMLAAEPKHTTAFFGVLSADSGATWTSLDGETDLYLPWSDDQPNIEDGPCALLFSNGTVGSGRCVNKERAFFCERVITKSLDKYVWVEQAARFYKYPGHHLTWDAAEAGCEADGGTLAIPDTEERVEAILGLLPSVANDVYVGFTDRENEGSFVSVTGRRLTDLEFQNWRNNQPNGNTGQNCLLLWTNGYYVDIECDTNHRFVCEVVP